MQEFCLIYLKKVGIWRMVILKWSCRGRRILAKHDENYIPPQVKQAIEEAGHPTGK